MNGFARFDPQEEAPRVKDIAVVPFACRSLTFDGELFWSNYRAKTRSFHLLFRTDMAKAIGLSRSPTFARATAGKLVDDAARQARCAGCNHDAVGPPTPRRNFLSAAASPRSPIRNQNQFLRKIRKVLTRFGALKYNGVAAQN